MFGFYLLQHTMPIVFARFWAKYLVNNKSRSFTEIAWLVSALLTTTFFQPILHEIARIELNLSNPLVNKDVWSFLNIRMASTTNLRRSKPSWSKTKRNHEKPSPLPHA